jgi:uncharacterized protein (TIGR00162 family)
MDEVDVVTVADPDLDEPAFVEGLPGVGHVGKLAAEHLVEEFDGDLVRRVHSEHFPPQVTVDSDSVASLAAAEIYAVDADGRDLLVLVGDFQAGDAVGQYRVAEAFLDVADSFDASEVLALGGAPTGEIVEEYTVIGALTDASDRGRFADAGVEFRESEPAGGIVGTSGLLLGLGERRGLPAACLMGETSGYLVDPRSAQAVLEVLQTILGFEVDYGSLEERAEELEEVIRDFQEQGGGGGMDAAPGDEDLRYIG